STVIAQALPRTIVLFLTATLFAFWLGFKSGKLIAWGRGSKAEQGFIIGGVFLQTVFYPWFAIVMMWRFGFMLGWFPISRFIDARLWQGAPYNANTLFGQMILSALIVTLLYAVGDRKSTRLNSSHVKISYAVFCLKKKSNVTHL